MAKLNDDYSPLPPDPSLAKTPAEKPSPAAQAIRSNAKPAGHDSKPARARMPIRRAEDADREAILESLRGGHTLAAAAAAGGLSSRALFNWRRRDREWSKQVEEARDLGRRRRTEELEDVLFQGAEKVLADPRYQTSIIFALRNLDPEHWRDGHDLNQRIQGRHEHSLAPGGDLAALCRRVAAECAGAEGEEPPMEGEVVQECEREPASRLLERILFEC